MYKLGTEHRLADEGRWRRWCGWWTKLQNGTNHHERSAPAIIKKIRTLAQIAHDLREGEHFSLTRLTLLKSLCNDPEAAAKFALHLAKKTQQAMKSQSCPDYVEAKTWQRYQRLAASGVRGMTRHRKEGATETEEPLRELLTEIRNAQNRYEKQGWGLVRIIECLESLVVQTALGCVLRPRPSPDLGYFLARQYAERYNSQHGTGLIPDSAPMVEDIAEFWGRHFLRGPNKSGTGTLSESGFPAFREEDGSQSRFC
jgi:hypothetical protein